jgi:hypothetical protein
MCKNERIKLGWAYCTYEKRAGKSRSCLIPDLKEARKLEGPKLKLGNGAIVDIKTLAVTNGRNLAMDSDDWPRSIQVCRANDDDDDDIYIYY